MSKKFVYLDNAAATNIFKEVIDEVSSVSQELFANPSSLHGPGRLAAEKLDSSRASISDFFNCGSEQVYFTSSGTESSNLALIGIARANKAKGNHIITTSIEHPSIINACRSLEKEGFEVTYLAVGKDGLVNTDELEKSTKKGTVLISVHFANSELGIIQPIEPLVNISKSRGIYFHCDACQATAYTQLDFKGLGIDALTINGSKSYGPRGVGLLIIKESVDIFPIHFGGGQQRGLRSGTENVAGVAGLAKALEIISSSRLKQEARISKLRDGLQYKLEKLGVVINCKSSPRLANHLSIQLDIDKPDLVSYFSDSHIAVSAGSACSSRSLSDSYVLRGVGLSSSSIQKTLRISLGYDTNEEDLDRFIKIVELGLASR